MGCTQDKGNTAFKEMKYPEAVQFYTEALRRGPPSVNPEAHKLYRCVGVGGGEGGEGVWVFKCV